MSLFGIENLYYHGSIRRYTVLFGSLFSDMYIQREGEDVTQAIKVPLRYAKGFKYEKTATGKDTGKKIAEVLPAMAFQLESFVVDEGRQQNQHIQIRHTQADADDNVNYQMMRVPYNFTFSLAVRTRNTDDMLRIAEQILGAFNPTVTIKAEDLKNTEVDVEQDVTITLDPNIQMDDNAEDYTDNRHIDWEFSFVLKGHIYRRTKSAAMVREIQIQRGIPVDGSFVPLEMMFDAASPARDVVSVGNDAYKTVDVDMFGDFSVKKVEEATKTVRQRTTRRKTK